MTNNVFVFDRIMVKRPSTLVNRPHIYSLHSLHPSPHSSLPIVQMSLRNGENYLKDERIGTRLGSGWNKFRDSEELKERGLSEGCPVEGIYEALECKWFSRRAWYEEWRRKF
ncbi:hypothetical protein AYX13_06149 [Cryptococcus neoformans]|nr:hypothetical protein AYX13_06149 [Cryptococcus neoformans var. grubii]